MPTLLEPTAKVSPKGETPTSKKKEALVNHNGTQDKKKPRNKWKISIAERDAYVRQAMALAEIFPETFNLKKIKHPYAIGIFKEITDSFPEINKKFLTKQINWLTSTPAYLCLIITGKNRRHLDGSLDLPATENQKAQAEETLKERLEHYKRTTGHKLPRYSKRSLRCLYDPEDVIPHSLLSEAGISPFQLRKTWNKNRIRHPDNKRRKH